ncbi:hypothetical protein [Roseibacillus persicicus]|uniref:Uncharacterized protein n=1 Tax=Roseibacillus persicicus TaxID=454148 RepID=A0A918WED8_9BACT|nr:hypothetical protein [Roseibacillus persicicus]GHC43521.1 hypothetical protein GCM10007100_05840 [Roseibacillus persicicus]
MDSQSDNNSLTKDAIRRGLLKNPAAPKGPVQFRSWKEQTIPPLENQPGNAPLSAKKRRKNHSLWHNRDLRLILAVALTASVALAVYYSMKGL